MDRGHSATVSTHRIIRDSVVQSIFLGERVHSDTYGTHARVAALKALMLAFHRQMTTHWVKVAKIARELIAKRLGGPALFTFIEFLLTLDSPVTLLVLPCVQIKVSAVQTRPTERAQRRVFSAQPKAQLGAGGGMASRAARACRERAEH